MARADTKSGSEASFASLGPTLLARKGGAKPAMRPQVAALPDMAVVDLDTLEDLGWNDMGESEGGSAPKKQSAQKLKKSATSKKTKRPKKATNKQAKRAAFTLRLDADRHLKLRLAATMHGMSAQALVTDAIDAMFSDIEDLEAIAKRMKRN